MRKFVSICLLVFGLGDAGSAQIRAGVAKTVITPPMPMWLSGYAGRDEPAKGVIHDLWAKALVVEDGAKGRVVIVTTDLLGLSHDISELVAQQVDSLYGIKRSQLLLNSSHTHSGPMIWPCVEIIYEFSFEQQRAIALYNQDLAARLVKVIGEAVQHLAPASLSCGHGTAPFAINRRNDIYPNGPTDHDVPVLKVTGADGHAAAILFGYACHNTTLVADNFLINGDYAGFAQLAIEAANPGAQAMFIQGCAGDQNPAPRGTQELARQHGGELGDAVQKVLLGQMRDVHVPIRTAYTTAILPYRPFDVSIYRAELAGNNKYQQRRAKLMLEAYNKGWKADHLNYPVQAVRFGNTFTILAMSGEVVVDYSLRAKREFAGENLFVSGYSHEVMCYIPSERVLKEGGYEGAESMIYYGQPGPFAAGVENIIFDAIRKVMKEAGAK